MTEQETNYKYENERSNKKAELIAQRQKELIEEELTKSRDSEDITPKNDANTIVGERYDPVRGVEDAFDFEFGQFHGNWGAYYEVGKKNAQGFNDERLMMGLIKQPVKTVDLNGLVLPIYNVSVEMLDGKNNLIERYDFETHSIPDLVDEFDTYNLWQNQNRFGNGTRLGFLNYIFNIANGLMIYKKQNLAGGFVSLDLLPTEYPSYDDFIKGFESFKRIFEALPSVNQQIILALIIANFKYLIVTNGSGKFPGVVGNVYAYGSRKGFKTGSANIAMSLFRSIDGNNLSSSHGGKFNTAVSIRRALSSQAGFLLVDEAEAAMVKNPDEVVSILKNIYEPSLTVTDRASDTDNTVVNLLAAPYFTSNDELAVFNKAEIQRRTYTFEVRDTVDLGFEITKDMLNSHICLGTAIAHTLHPDILKWEDMGDIDDVNILLDHIWTCIETEYSVDCTVFKKIKLAKDVSEEKLLYDLSDGVIDTYGVNWNTLINRCFYNDEWADLPFIVKLKNNMFGIKKRLLINWVKRHISQNSGLSTDEILRVLGLDRFTYSTQRDNDNRVVQCINTLSKDDLLSMFDELRDENLSDDDESIDDTTEQKRLNFVKERY